MNDLEELLDEYARHLAGELTMMLHKADLWGNYDRNARERERRWRRRMARLVGEVADE